MVVGTSLSLLMFGSATKASAEIITVDPEDYLDTKNSLILQSTPDIKEFKVETNIPTDRLEVFEKGKDAESAEQHGIGFFNSGEFKTMNYPTYEKNYRSTGLIISDPDGTEEITVTQSNVGTYQSKAVDMTVRYYDIVYQLNYANVQPNKIFFDFSESPFSGYSYGNARFKVELSFYYSEDKTAVDFSGDSYLTINSLNGGRSGYDGEYVNYLNEATNESDSTTNAYLAEQTNIAVRDVTDVGTVFIGDSNDFVDGLGSESFIRNSVSFQISGETQKFVVGSGFGAAWNTFSSATVFNVKPEAPIKTVTDESGTNINKEQVVAGQKLVYRIKQTVHNLGVDILQRYYKLEISDPLPEQFIYSSSTLVDENGNEVDQAGSYLYDKETHTLTYQASDDFLTEMPLTGESYELVIEGTVSEDVAAADVLINQAKVTINSYDAETNEVENNGADSEAQIRKVILDGTEEREIKSVAVGDQVVFALPVTISNKFGLTSIVIYDDLEDVLAVEAAGIKIVTTDNTDITGEFTVEVEKDVEKVTVTAKEPQKWQGLSFIVHIPGVVKDTDFQSYVDDNGDIMIPNVAELRINDQVYHSNKVHVTVPQDKPAVLPSTNLDLSNNHSGILLSMIVAVGVVAATLGGTFVYFRYKENTRKKKQ